MSESIEDLTLVDTIIRVVFSYEVRTFRSTRVQENLQLVKLHVIINHEGGVVLWLGSVSLHIFVERRQFD